MNIDSLIDYDTIYIHESCTIWLKQIKNLSTFIQGINIMVDLLYQFRHGHFCISLLYLLQGYGGLFVALDSDHRLICIFPFHDQAVWDLFKH